MKKIILMLLIVNIVVMTIGQRTYNYPIKPGSKEWKSLKTHQQKVDACNIPTDTIRKLNTEDLIMSYINYPLLGDIFAFNNLQDGFNILTLNFNGLQELLKRKDLAHELIRLYKKIESNNMDVETQLFNKDFDAFNISAFELLLCQPTVLMNLTLVQKKDLINEAQKKLEAKLKNNRKFGLLSCTHSILIMARVLNEENFEPFLNLKEKNKNINIFIESVHFFDPKMLDSICFIAQQYLEYISIENE